MLESRDAVGLNYGKCRSQCVSLKAALIFSIFFLNVSLANTPKFMKM